MKKFVARKAVKAATTRETIKMADYIERFFAGSANDAGYNIYVDTDMNMELKPKTASATTPEIKVDTIQDGEIRFEVTIKVPDLASTEDGIMDGLDDFQNIIEDWQKVAALAEDITLSSFDPAEID